MSLSTPAKEAKRKRKSTDNSSQLQEPKRLRSQEPTPKPKAQPKDEDRQPFSNQSLTKENIKQLALSMTEKPFPDPENQSQTIANQAWKKQNVYRKRQTRSEAKREEREKPRMIGHVKIPITKAVGYVDIPVAKAGGEDTATKDEDENIPRGNPRMVGHVEITVSPKLRGEDVATKDEGEKKPRKEKKLKVDKRTKRTKEDIGSEDGIADALVKVEEQKTKRHVEEGGKKETKAKDKKVKMEEVEEMEDVDVFPQELIAERVVANRGNWAASKPAGGRFINHDPVFSFDEKFLFLATSRDVQVYSTSESLLVRSIPIRDVVTYTLSLSNPNFLYVVTSSREITLFDWTTGKEIKKSVSVLPISAIVVAQISRTNQDTLFAIQREESEAGLRDHITIQNISSPAVRLFFVQTQILRHLQVLDHGRTIIAASETKLCIGTLSGPPIDASTELADLPSRYVWRTLNTIEPVTCLDAQIRSVSSSGTSKKQRLICDLVFGNLKGEVIVYEDIVFKLEENEKLKGKDVALKPIVNHWHREAPATVKWSLDGNYVISGGKETVLCLWQRETSKRQLLPHLTSAIESLSVSPSGTSYAVRLADNSAMVLSTSELQPKTNIAGLQSRFVPTSQSAAATKNPLNSFVRTPAIGNPRNSKQLIMAVPTSQISGDAVNPPAPFLQVFDVYTSRHVSRQALTRNMVTSINVGPEGNKVREPNVTLLQVSSDGQWLATIEEWNPPTADVVHMAPENDVLDQEVRRRRETYLKFWRWNDEEEGYWALDTRIDFPHQSSIDPHANRVFDLVSNPAETGFATIGEDSLVRVWQPKTKLADGRIVRGARDGVITTWTCSYETGLDSTAVPLENEIAFTNGKLAYSNDGSILAATQQNGDASSANIIHFLNASNGTIRLSESAFHASCLIGMGFINRYFITLSEELRVWDLVANKLVYGFKLATPAISATHKENISFLAINNTSNTFAIAVLNKPDNLIPGLNALDTINLVGVSTSVVVFDPSELAPLFAMEVPGVVSALVDVKGAVGFFVLDAQAEVRVLGPKISAFVAPEADNGDIELEAPVEADARDDEDDMDEDEDEGVVALLNEKDNGSDVDMDVAEDGDLLDGDKHVVAPEKLAELFNGVQSFAMPSVKDLFYDVVGLYARKKDDGAAL